MVAEVIQIPLSWHWDGHIFLEVHESEPMEDGGKELGKGRNGHLKNVCWV
jgi:hypothetical protein